MNRKEAIKFIKRAVANAKMLTKEEILENRILRDMRNSHWYAPITRARELYRSISYAHNNPLTINQSKNDQDFFERIEKNILKRKRIRISSLVPPQIVDNRGIVIVQRLNDYRAALEITNIYFNEVDVECLYTHEKEHGMVGKRIARRFNGEVLYGLYFRGRHKQLYCYTYIATVGEITALEWRDYYLAPSEPSEEDFAFAAEEVSNI